MWLTTVGVISSYHITPSVITLTLLTIFDETEAREPPFILGPQMRFLYSIGRHIYFIDFSDRPTYT